MAFEQAMTTLKDKPAISYVIPSLIHPTKLCEKKDTATDR